MYHGRDKARCSELSLRCQAAWHRPVPELPSGICEQPGGLNCLHVSIRQERDHSSWGRTHSQLDVGLPLLWLVFESFFSTVSSEKMDTSNFS